MGIDFNALVEEQVAAASRQWERVEERLQQQLEKQREEISRLREELRRASPSSEPHWLYKDFNVLYRAALDVSESDVRMTSECPPPLRTLRAQLERLAMAFQDTEEVRAAMREKR